MTTRLSGNFVEADPHKQYQQHLLDILLEIFLVQELKLFSRQVLQVEINLVNDIYVNFFGEA